MEPRFIKRGDAVGVWLGVDLRLASMEPRFIKRGDPHRKIQRDEGDRSGFNGAPLHQAGRPVQVRRGTGRVDASMEPRFIKRGDSRRVRRTLCPSQSFNGAPLHQAGRLPRMQAVHCTLLMASMEPRFIKRGDLGD